MKRVGLVTAALVAAVAIWTWSLPPRHLGLGTTADGTVRGALHVHSQVSDGMGTADEIADAAARAGLQFIVLTDHGDATRAPEPPAYRSGVLVLDAVEISTRGGHYVAIGLPQSPYPLAGDPRDVVADVRRMGGFGIVAHPDSPKADLHWRDWSLPFDAVELVNLDTAWRQRATQEGRAGQWRLARSLLAYPLRPAEAIANLIPDTTTVRDAWLTTLAARSVVALAGTDAHAKVELMDRDPGDNRFSLALPSYQASFESLSVHVRPGRPFTGNASSDATSLIEGLRAGAAFVAVDGWASPASLELTATDGRARASMGGAISGDLPTTLHVKSNAPDGYRTLVWRDRDVIAERLETEFDVPVAGRGIYRVEVRRQANDGPSWVMSNPIRVGEVPPSRPSVPAPAGTVVRPLFDGRTLNGWSHENDPVSVAALDIMSLLTGPRVHFRYGLARGATVGQYVAAAVETSSGVDGTTGVAFRARADTPMRLAVQVRAEVPGAEPERWERSVFLSPDETAETIRFEDMTPVGVTHSAHAPLAGVRTVLFVIETTNAKPGASGQVWLGDVRLVRD